VSEGIEFILELQAKLEGATKMAQALSNVERVMGRTDHAMTRLEVHGGGVLHHLTDWFKDFGKAASSSFTGMFTAEAAWDTLKEGVHLLKELVGEMFEAAAEGERTRMAFENMLGPEAGRQLLGNLDRFSGASEFGRSTVKGFAQELLDAGYSGQNLSLALSAVSDVAARSSNKMAGAQNALAALSRIMLTGTMDARALRMLRLAPKTVFAQMSRDFGLGLGELKKRLQSGKLRPEEVANSVFRALAAKGGGVLGRAGADMADSFGARWEKLKGALPAIFEHLEEAPGFKGFSDAVQSLVDDLSPEGTAGKQILAGLGNAFNQVGETVKSIDWVTGINTFVEVGGATIKVVGDIGSAFGTVLGIVKSTGDQVEDFLESLITLGHLTDKLGLTSIGDRESRQRAAINAEYAASPSAIAARAKHAVMGQRVRALRATVAMGDVTQLFPGLDQGLRLAAAVGPAGEAGKAVGKAAGEGIATGAQQGLGVHSPSAHFRWLGEMSARGFQDGLEMTPPSASARGLTGGGIELPASRGPVSISAPVTVHVAGSEASAEDIAEAVRAEVASAILGTLEQLGFVVGSA
jgi:tape measure domain-containing protein